MTGALSPGDVELFWAAQLPVRTADCSPEQLREALAADRVAVPVAIAPAFASGGAWWARAERTANLEKQPGIVYPPGAQAPLGENDGDDERREHHLWATFRRQQLLVTRGLSGVARETFRAECARVLAALLEVAAPEQLVFAGALQAWLARAGQRQQLDGEALAASLARHEADVGAARLATLTRAVLCSDAPVEWGERLLAFTEEQSASEDRRDALQGTQQVLHTHLVRSACLLLQGKTLLPLDLDRTVGVASLRLEASARRERFATLPRVQVSKRGRRVATNLLARVLQLSGALDAGEAVLAEALQRWSRTGRTGDAASARALAAAGGRVTPLASLLDEASPFRDTGRLAELGAALAAVGRPGPDGLSRACGEYVSGQAQVADRYPPPRW